jgi:hypothetical protein
MTAGVSRGHGERPATQKAYHVFSSSSRVLTLKLVHVVPPTMHTSNDFLFKNDDGGGKHVTIAII